MKVVIVGQGATGLLWYSQLAQQQTQVSLLCSKTIKTMPKVMSFTDLNQQKTDIPLVKADDNMLAQANLVVFCLKAFDQITAIKNIAQRTASGTVFIMAHNGMVDTISLNQEIKSNHPLLTLLTTHGCKRVDPFAVVHTGSGHSDLGLTAQSTTHKKVFSLPLTQKNSIVELLNSALPSLSWHKHIKEKQWLKLAVNCVINPITAIENIDNGEILSPAFNEKIDGILSEIIAVAEKEKIEFEHSRLKASVMQVAKLTARNSSSMRCDFLNKKASEIAHITGYIVDLGRKHQVATPVNTQLRQQIETIEKSYLR